MVGNETDSLGLEQYHSDRSMTTALSPDSDVRRNLTTGNEPGTPGEKSPLQDAAVMIRTSAIILQ